MSMAVEMKELDYDLEILEGVFKDLGCYIHREGWAVKNFDLAVRSPKGNLLQFKKQENGKVSMTIDEDYKRRIHGEMAENILPKYVEAMSKRYARGRYKIKEQTKVGNKVQLRLGVR